MFIDSEIILTAYLKDLNQKGTLWLSQFDNRPLNAQIDEMKSIHVFF